MEYESTVQVPTYLIVCFVSGIILSVFEMWYVRFDAKINPQKYKKEEDPRVKSFFDVI